MNKYGNRIVCGLFLSSVVLNQGLLHVSAENLNTPKEEVVYGMLDESGDVTGIYVVNSFTDSEIVDYGNYSDIRNLTSTDKLTLKDGKITGISSVDKLYYQGNLKTSELPWKIDIRYYMDNTEYSPKEIAGKSGKLKICIDITQNKACDSSFWDGYALQTTLVLDSTACKNIQADKATIANVGADKQLSYIILPGKGANLEITAEVSDFEMDEIQINGTKLNLEFEADTSELDDKIQEIQDAIKSLNEGADELKDGTVDLEDGAKQIYDGTVKLQDGASSLDNGIKSLNKGISSVQNALKTLDSKSDSLTSGSAEVLDTLKTIQTSLKGVSIESEKLSELASASTQMKSGIDQLVAGLNSMDGSIDTYYQSLSQAGMSDVNTFVNQHKQAISSLGITDTQRELYAAYVAGGEAAVQQKLMELAASGNQESIVLAQSAKTNQASIQEYIAGAGKLISIETLLKADVVYIQGSHTLIGGIDSQLDSNNGELMKGALSLQSNYIVFDENVQQMTESLGTLVENMTTLKQGINSLVKEYTKLDSGLGEYTDAVSSITEAYKKIYRGALDIADGAGDLYDGTTDLVSGTLEMYDGSKELSDGAVELKDGTQEFYDETSDMETEISDSIDDTINEMVGNNIETVSFVSDKNENIESVLFVMKTPAIEVEENVEEEVQQEKEKGLWDKFLDLFRK